MTSSRPYLVRALYEWIVDNGMTPYLLVDAKFDQVTVPIEHVEDGKIILNVGPMAVTGIILGNDDVTFSARFSGNPFSVYLPIHSILAIYAKENGQGMMFGEDDGSGPDPQNNGSDDGGADNKRPSLRVVK